MSFMEILGSTFDDSVFEESRNRVSAALPKYEPKLCHPLASIHTLELRICENSNGAWFTEAGYVGDPLEDQRGFKFRGDLAYRRKQYQRALDEYVSCLSLVPAGNVSVRRDVLEGIARCCCHLGKKDEALKACQKLRTEVSNTSHLTCVLQLEQSIHEHHRDLSSSVSSLQKRCCLHPYHPWHWLKLGMSLQILLENLNCSLEAPPSDEEEYREKGLETHIVLAQQTVMCLIRSRMLIEILQVQQFSFVLEKSQRALQDIEEALHDLQPTDRMLHIVSEVMAEDLNPEKMREENQDGESLLGLSIKDFDERWWNKLYTRLREEKALLVYPRIPEGS
ncbi:hypothetical protein DNTS_005495 [Danionella cerebrum]|uniref:Uncharacterized protein n=1 Tax=Danionella cerebrum TaxID=2873325 RepID=A0A553PYI4_9TELE|nr:hypothetical protein DNTS_005495 [Danionella translucida]TRY82739.1 hypothetical protein DNTS_005495 [Danionella translucida]